MEKVDDDAADTKQELQGPWLKAGQAEDRAERLHVDTYNINYLNYFGGDTPSLEVKSAADMASWAGQPHIKGSSESMRMALLTTSLIGLQ